MDRDIAVALLDQLHAAQNGFYGGGDALLRDLLVFWHRLTQPYRGDAERFFSPQLAELTDA